MALNKLTTGEMIAISKELVDPATEANRLMKAVPEVAPVLERLQAAHRGLLDTQPRAPSSARLEALSQQAVNLDLRHDTIQRAIDQILNGFALAAPDPARAEGVAKLRQLLLPDGLTATQRTYRDEAGQGALLDKRLTAAERAALAELRTPFGTVLDLVNEWIALAAQLGTIEDERGRLTQDKPTPPTQADVVTARNRWIRAMNAVDSMLALAETTEPTIAKILGSLRAAERTADGRGTKRPSEG